MDVNSIYTREAYNTHMRSYVQRYGEESWKFDYPTWCNAWRRSNLWDKRGRNAGQYAMFSVDESLPLSYDNYQILSKEDGMVLTVSRSKKQTVDRKSNKKFIYKGKEFESLKGLRETYGLTPSEAATMRRSGEIEKVTLSKVDKTYHTPYGSYGSFQSALYIVRLLQSLSLTKEALHYRFRTERQSSYSIEVSGGIYS